MPALRKQVDVAVIGGGPAGSAAAMTLARAGRTVLLVEKNGPETFKVGESLPPAARPLLRQLGLMERFNADQHLPSYGNQSAWGSHILHSTDFIKDPNGHGWHLDRPRFDAMLNDAAREAGAGIREATGILEYVPAGGGDWRLVLTGENSPAEVRARWMIDCTGRSASIARHQGVKRISYDHLLAFVALFSPPKDACPPDHNSLTIIESTPEGWWYTALIPTERRVVVYLTDADTKSSKSARNLRGYTTLLDQTEHIRARLAAHGYTIDEAPKVMAANSARLQRFVGDRWLAAGDACASFDPLSSQGILTALYSGFKAGLALDAYMRGEMEALDAYERNISSVYDTYLQNRTTYYRIERRWPGSTFWQRRQGKVSNQMTSA